MKVVRKWAVRNKMIMKEKSTIVRVSLLSTVSNISRNKHHDLLLERKKDLVHMKKEEKGMGWREGRK